MPSNTDFTAFVEDRAGDVWIGTAEGGGLLRYREGIGNYLEVLSAESPLLAQQSLDAELRSRQLALSINLIRALGGGFDDRAVAIAAVR